MKVYNIEPLRSSSFNAYRSLAYTESTGQWQSRDQLDKRKTYGYYHDESPAIDFIEIRQ